MTSTRIEWSFNKISRLADLSDLAAMLFPGNRNQQHAFLVLWIALKYSEHRMVPNFGEAAVKHGVPRRTLERVRAKMRRMGLIDHVSRFNADHGYREGWVYSKRFERSLRQLAEIVGLLKEAAVGQREKDLLLLELLDGARRAVREQDDVDQSKTHDAMEYE